MGGILLVHGTPELLCELENVTRDSTGIVASSEWVKFEF